MHEPGAAFFGTPVADKLVRGGNDVRLPRDRESGATVHTAPVVYREMLLQICRDYASLPDPRTLSLDEICTFYDGLRSELRQSTRPTSVKR